jgi:hypothetical protein
MELNLGAWLEESGAQFNARIDDIVVAHGVPVELDGRVRVVVVVRATEHLHHNLVSAKRESFEHNLANQWLPSNEDAQTLVVELQFCIEGKVAFIVGL